MRGKNLGTNAVVSVSTPASWTQQAVSACVAGVWWIPLLFIFISVPLSVWVDGEFWAELGPALVRGMMISGAVAVTCVAVCALSFTLWRVGGEWQRSYVRWVATFPASVSTLMLALALALLYGFRAPLSLLIVTQCLLFWPLTWRLGWARLVGWPERLSEAARLSGASVARTFREIE